jgi:hypothetical protein
MKTTNQSHTIFHFIKDKSQQNICKFHIKDTISHKISKYLRKNCNVTMANIIFGEKIEPFTMNRVT